MSIKAWYVVQVKAHRETQVNTYLTYHNVETFYPTIAVKPVNPRASRIQPYFPRYLFIHLDLNEISIDLLNWVPGAIGLVQFDDRPASIPETVIHGLKQKLLQLNANDRNYVEPFHPGDPVTVVSGPLAGYEGIFDTGLGSEERVRILLNILHRSVTVKINARAIEKRHNICASS